MLLTRKKKKLSHVYVEQFNPTLFTFYLTLFTFYDAFLGYLKEKTNDKYTSLSSCSYDPN